ncbi:PEP-CTERM sorting domain-containing protein [Roseibacillus persicicus]|uniref:Ice-binding protein C-terminal domain-containing protein n=1 Tax=Roseibacillus persicicus TaxID=454148 RepID=A0A918TDU3_9BACT|nr:PEP-CTERM sorting domain-containing protein [Roseibacillus persicicus]GHC40198.1 hypothetical protein GCM10007100_00700 [Roseibacillus persicicus]
MKQTTHIKFLAGLTLFAASASSLSAAALVIANPSFEDDTAPAVGATGWTVVTTGGNGFFVATAGSPDSTVDPDSAAAGSNWLSGNRLVTGTGSSGSGGTQTMFQVVDISADAALIDSGSSTVGLTWQFADNDPADEGFVTISFFSDVAGTTPLGTSLTTGGIAATSTTGNSAAPWVLEDLSGAVPAGARSLSIELEIVRTSGSAGNIHFDDFTGSIDAIPEPSTALLGLCGAGLLFGRRRKC